MIHFADDTNFATAIEDTRPVLVKFEAEWCQPCKRLAPILDEFAAENIQTVKVVVVDAERSSITGDTYNVNTVPMLLLFADGKVVKTVKGRTKDAILVEVTEALI